MTSTPDVTGLNDLIDWLEEHPDQHNQSDWRCTSGMCLAGWRAERDGWRWLKADPDDLYSNFVLIDTPARQAWIEEHNLSHAVQHYFTDADYVTSTGHRIRSGSIPVIEVKHVAAASLGLTEDQAEWLFEPVRSTTNMREAAQALAIDPAADLADYETYHRLGVI